MTLKLNLIDNNDSKNVMYIDRKKELAVETDDYDPKAKSLAGCRRAMLVWQNTR